MEGNMKPNIEVYSTLARNVFINESGQIIKKLLGGPATFIQQTLDTVAVPYTLNLTNKVTVEILLTNQGEYGRIINPPKKKQVKPKKNKSLLLISTLLDEWMLPKKPSNIFLDIQGYVRNGLEFGGMKKFVINSELEAGLVCVKAEKNEAKILQPEFLERQKMKQLVITNGREGLDLFIKGKKYSISAQQISNLPDTVGAGDTWFSAYAAYQTLNFNCLTSAYKATNFVGQFLKNKKKEKYENK